MDIQEKQAIAISVTVPVNSAFVVHRLKPMHNGHNHVGDGLQLENIVPNTEGITGSSQVVECGKQIESAEKLVHLQLCNRTCDSADFTQQS